MTFFTEGNLYNIISTEVQISSFAIRALDLREKLLAQNILNISIAQPVR